MKIVSILVLDGLMFLIYNFITDEQDDLQNEVSILVLDGLMFLKRLSDTLRLRKGRKVSILVLDGLMFLRRD